MVLFSRLVFDILFGPGDTVEREEKFPGRDHFVRIRHLVCSCAVIHLHYKPEGTLQELWRRHRATSALWPTYTNNIGFLVGDFNICDPAVGRLNSRSHTFSDGDTSRATALRPLPLC